MSFSSDLKIELSKINNLKNKQEVYAEFLGYLVVSNTSIDAKNIKFSTENEYNINRFAKLLNNLNIVDYNIEIVGKTYSITFKNKDIKMVDKENINTILNTDNLKKAYIRGNFLGGGSVNNPKNKYHLEIIFKTAQYVQITLELVNSFGISMKSLDKTLYLKDGEVISNFLALMGANSSVLKFEEIRVLREMKNNVK